MPNHSTLPYALIDLLLLKLRWRITECLGRWFNHLIRNWEMQIKTTMEIPLHALQTGKN